MISVSTKLIKAVRATLLLSQSPSQSINQQRVESYLSASNSPNLDIADHLETPLGTIGGENGRSSYTNGSSSPRDLTLRIKILELYTLHILPRNGEWTYAKEFINMSDVLDEERREALLHSLQSLQDEKSNDHDNEERLIREKAEKLKGEREEIGRRRLEESQARDERLGNEQKELAHKRTGSEKDYGIDGPNSVPAGSKPSSHLLKPVVKSAKDSPSKNSRPSSTTSSKKSKPVGIYRSSVAVVNALQQLISNMTYSLFRNPMLLLKFVLFLMGVVLALSRRDVKDRIRRITGSGWEKIKETVGMGVKVSYI